MNTNAAGRKPGGGLGRLTEVEGSRRAQSVLVTTARVLAALFAMAIPIVLVRVIDQQTFGYYKQLFLVSQTAIGLLTLGLPASLFYFVPRAPERSQPFMLQTFVALLLLGMLGGAGILLAAPAIAAFFESPITAYLGWVALFTALLIPAQLLRSAPMVDRRARLQAATVTGFDLLRGALLVGVALWTGDLTFILLAACAVAAFQLGALVSYLRWRGRGQGRDARPRVGMVLEQWRYALPFAGAAIVAMLRNQIHAYWVAGNFSAAEFAVYAVATLNIPLIGFLTQTVGEVVILENARNFAQDDLGEMRRIWRRAICSLALIMLPIFAGAQVFAEDLMRVVFTAEYGAAAPIFRVYMFLLPLTMVMASPMLRATGDVRLMLGADLVSLAANLGLLIFLAPRIGPIGAVGSLVGARAVFVAIASRRALRRLQAEVRTLVPWRTLGACTLLAFGSMTGAYLSLRLAPEAIRLVIGAMLGTLVYAGVAWRVGIVPESERQALRRLAARLPFLRRNPEAAS